MLKEFVEVMSDQKKMIQKNSFQRHIFLKTCTTTCGPQECHNPPKLVGNASEIKIYTSKRIIIE